MAHLCIENIDFHYVNAKDVKPVLRHASLEVERGELLSILGPSGCGKSTLLYLIAGLYAPKEGRICLDGHEVTGPDIRCSMVFQQPSLFPWLTALDNVAFFARQARKGLRTKEARTLAEDALRQMNLSYAKDMYPRQLSGGMQQRVAVARALAVDAEVLLLDEPFGALDPKNRLDLQELLEQVMKERRRTVLLVTHDVDEAVLLSDRVAFLENGTIARVIEVPLERPRHGKAVLLTSEAQSVRKELIDLFYEPPMQRGDVG